ncbi:MAG: redoxin domain-containing protein [bacterium]|nr:redoxin domain-containing protein [bacterium]
MKLSHIAFAGLAVLSLTLTGCGQKPTPQNQSPVALLPTALPSPAPMMSEPLESSGVETTSVVAAADDMNVRDYHAYVKQRRGKPLLVNFWATNCGPCVQEMPQLVQVYEEYKGKVDFLAMSCDSFFGSERNVPGMMKKLGMTLPTRILTANDAGDAITSIDPHWMGALPRTIVYDIDGNIVDRLQGEQTRDSFTATLKKVLGS